MEDQQKSNFVKYMPLFRLEPIVMAYYLGFDVRSCFPTEQELQERYFELSSQGPEVFFSKMKEQNLARYPNAVNQKDTSDREWADYLPSDLMPYYEGGQCYVFTQPDVKGIAMKQINPYTEKTLSPYFISAMILTSSQDNHPRFVAEESLRGLIEDPTFVLKPPRMLTVVSDVKKIVDYVSGKGGSVESIGTMLNGWIDSFKRL